MKPAMVFRLLILSAALAVMSCARNEQLQNKNGGAAIVSHGHRWLPILGQRE